MHSVFFTLFFTTFFALNCFGQYSYVNHYDWVKPRLNPAAVGVNNTENISMIYNRSWIANEVNSSLGILQYDRAFLSRQNETIGGFGVSISNNRIDYKDILSRFQASLSAAYSVKVGPIAMLNFGLQGSYYADQVNNSGLFTGNQYVPGLGFDPGRSSGEPGSSFNVNYVGLGTGAFLYQASDGILPANYLGLSVLNINRPVNSFFDNDSRLSPQINLMGGLKVFESMKSEIVAEALYSNSNQKGNVTIGGVYEIKYLGNSGMSLRDISVRFVSRYSVNNKFLVGGQLIYEQFAIGLSYDIRTGLTERSYDSGFEFLIALNRKVKPRRKKTSRKKQPIEMPLSNQAIEVIVPDDSSETQQKTTFEVLSDTITLEDEKSGKASIGEIQNSPPIQNLIYFEFGSKQIDGPSMEHLRDFVVEFYRSKKNMVMVTGYTDNIGDEEFNVHLSIGRARSVKEKLIEFGLRPDQIQINGKGESQPAFPNDTKQNRAKNRRVEITFL